jgi:hypothetical protein
MSGDLVALAAVVTTARVMQRSTQLEPNEARVTVVLPLRQHHLLNPKPQTPNPKPQTLGPKTLNPSSTSQHPQSDVFGAPSLERRYRAQGGRQMMCFIQP